METYAGIDLHSSNNFIGVINEKIKSFTANGMRIDWMMF